MGSAGVRYVRAKRSPRQRVQAGRPQSLQFGGSRLCAFGFVPVRGQQEHMPRGAVVVRASSFTENDDIGAVQVCRASRCSSAFWMCASLEVLHDLISVVVIQCRQGGNIMASGPPSCSCSRYRRGIGRGTVCEGQALAQAAGTGRASSELAIRRLSSLRLWFRSRPWATRAHATWCCSRPGFFFHGE